MNLKLKHYPAAQEPGEPLPTHSRDGGGVADHVWTLQEIAGLFDS